MQTLTLGLYALYTERCPTVESLQNCPVDPSVSVCFSLSSVSDVPVITALWEAATISCFSRDCHTLTYFINGPGI